MSSRFTEEPGDTPLRSVPADYHAGGSPRWLVLEEGPDAGRRLHFVDRRLGGGDGPVVLFVHGNPECSYTYRKVIAALQRRSLPSGTRLVAPDHIGFGRSDQARFEMVDMHHAANLAQLVAALDLRDVTLVVHDWGGPIGVGALLREPDRVANLVVLNSTVFPLPRDGLTYENYPVPVLMPWHRMADRVPDRLWGDLAAFAVGLTPSGAARLLARQAAFLARRAAGGSPPGPEGDAVRVFRGQFASRANVRSSKRMVRQTPVWGHGYAYDDPVAGRQDNRAFYRDIQERIGPAWGPGGRAIGAAGVFGAWDPVAKDAVLDQWRAALPQMEIEVHRDVSHFVEEHRPEEIAGAIARLLARA